MADEQATSSWAERPERSNVLILRVMVWLSLHLGRTLSRVVLYGIAVYFFLFAPTARRASRAYLTRALGRKPRLADGFKQILAFASTIHDRVYLLNGRFDLFNIEITGADQIRAVMDTGSGVLLIGAHLGSFEVMRALGRKYSRQPVTVLMYEENARKVNAALAAINPAAMQDIIALGRMDSMLLAREKLAAGHLVGMLADRCLGDDSSQAVEFLGTLASFPIGPFRVAAMLQRPVLFMAGLYLGGNRYRIHFEPLADFTAVPRDRRDAAIAAAQTAYVARLEHFCRLAPYNWFNFFDFWRSAEP
ncbi:acyl-CoA synthetase [Azonexus sp.]|uniref:LpxL/LpxP family acyltransferase n=1 Tax=Azonexus sp. TaxID=1872668 RepID=UPI00282EDBFD|nr:acyl-CoA synthetase [Azonexus sp.]MDR1994751.1 acyl-CoA synthetase [Azonexus sp.]